MPGLATSMRALPRIVHGAHPLTSRLSRESPPRAAAASSSVNSLRAMARHRTSSTRSQKRRRSLVLGGEQRDRRSAEQAPAAGAFPRIDRGTWRRRPPATAPARPGAASTRTRHFEFGRQPAHVGKARHEADHVDLEGRTGEEVDDGFRASDPWPVQGRRDRAAQIVVEADRDVPVATLTAGRAGFFGESQQGLAEARAGRRWRGRSTPSASGMSARGRRRRRFLRRLWPFRGHRGGRARARAWAGSTRSPNSTVQAVSPSGSRRIVASRSGGIAAQH